jgi:hypothetical protein
MRCSRQRAGIQAIEVIVTIVVVAVIFLVLLTALPRQREVSRRMTCQKNLARIGTALILFDQRNRTLPPVPALGGAPSDQPAGPIPALLQAFSQPDFGTMDDVAKGPPKPRPRPSGNEWRIVGLRCPSDRNAMSDRLRPPVSYRATTGASASGRDGAFAPRRPMTLSQLSNSDGAGFTAAFSERLVGDGSLRPNVANYALVPGDIDDASCPASDDSAWRGDAGLSWSRPSWVSTLYNHTMVPGSTPSCISRDGRTARMGASSGHVGGTHVLLFDLSVRTYAPTVDLKVWRELATINDSQAPAPP